MRRQFVPLRGALTAPIFAVALMLSAEAQATDYYLRSSNCNDSVTLPTATTPWCTLSKMSSVDFEAGDVIYLAKGSTWIDDFAEFQATDVGGSGVLQQIKLTSYQPPDTTASLPLPHITGSKTVLAEQAAQTALKFTNAENWIVENVEISHVGVGILFNYTNIAKWNYENIRISNVKLHHIYGIVKGSPILFSAGIVFMSGGEPINIPAGNSLVRNVIIEDMEGYKNQDSISINFPASVTGAAKQTMNQLWLNRLYLHDDDANGQSSSCSDSLRLVKASNVTLMNSILEREASCFSNTGTAALFAGSTGALTIINNIIRDTPVTSNGSIESPDQGAIDLELDNYNTRIHGNIISGNRVGLECMMQHGALPPCHFDASNNAFLGNRKSAFFIFGTKRFAGMDNDGGNSTFKNNFFSAVPGARLIATEAEPRAYDASVTDPYALDSYQSASYNAQNYQWLKNITTTENGAETNPPLSHIDEFYAASRDFQGSHNINSRWQYWHKQSNTTWVALNHFNTQLRRWTSASNQLEPYVSRFELRPVINEDVAIAWKAPRTGTIAIRGRAAKSDIAPPTDGTLLLVSGANAQGDGVRVRISKAPYMNATQTYLWPSSSPSYQTISAGNLKGVNTQPLTTIQVTEGDFIVFEVNSYTDSRGDATTWAPMIAYVDDARQSLQWHFDTAGWVEYWGNSLGLAAPVIDDGALKLSITGNDPRILSRAFKVAGSTTETGLSGSKYKYVTLRLKHNLGIATHGMLRWTFEGDTQFQDRSNPLTYKAIPLSSSPDWQLVTLDLSGTWTNDKVITQLRLDPIDASEHEVLKPTVWVDYIRLDLQAP